MRAMIFAAGLGTRLRPITDKMPKALVPVGGEPLLHRLLVKLQHAGCSHVVINVHHHAAMIVDFVTSRDYGMRIDISDESDMLLDTGGGLRRAASFFKGDEPILVHNVDILSDLSFEELLAAHDPESLATLVVSQRDTSRYLMFDATDRMSGWMNIKTGETKPAELDCTSLYKAAFSGIHVVSPRIFGLMEKLPPKFSIIDFYLQFMHQYDIMAYRPAAFSMLDVGKIDSLAFCLFVNYCYFYTSLDAIKRF